jgi:hypothetical protein
MTYALKKCQIKFILKFPSPLEWLCHSSRGLPRCDTFPPRHSSLRACAQRQGISLKCHLKEIAGFWRGMPRQKAMTYALKRCQIKFILKFPSSLRGVSPRSRDLPAQGTIRQHHGDARTNSLPAIRGMTYCVKQGMPCPKAMTDALFLLAFYRVSH